MARLRLWLRVSILSTALASTLPHASPAAKCDLTLLLAANDELNTVAGELAGLRIEIDSKHSSDSAVASALEPDFEKRLETLHQALLGSQPSIRPDGNLLFPEDHMEG